MNHPLGEDPVRRAQSRPITIAPTKANAMQIAATWAFETKPERALIPIRLLPSSSRG
jgi:hypothetical protein